jgi:hypothetical protein
MPTITIELEPALLDTLNKRATLAGLSPERLACLDVRFASLQFLKNALEFMEGQSNG